MNTARRGEANKAEVAVVGTSSSLRFFLFFSSLVLFLISDGKSYTSAVRVLLSAAVWY